MYEDDNNDGKRDANEAPIEGVIIELYDDTGELVATTKTDATGRYSFSDLPIGKYTLRQKQPSGFFDGIDAAGNVNGQTRGEAQNPGDSIVDISLGWGESGVEYNFGELLPGSISGAVHSSTAEDCWNDPHAIPLAGVRIIFAVNGRTNHRRNGNKSIRTLRIR